MAQASDTRFVHGAARLSQRLQTISRNLALPVLTNEIGELLLRRTMDRFDREENPDGQPWQELAPTTIAAKRRQGYGNKGKLVRKGNLRNSIKLIRGSNAGTIFSNTGAGVRIGISDPTVVGYARVQNYGNAHVPARRFLGVGRLDLKAVDSFLRRRGEQALARS